jgi:hypothetical protein
MEGLLTEAEFEATLGSMDDTAKKATVQIPFLPFTPTSNVQVGTSAAGAEFKSISSVPKILGGTANESISSVPKILGGTANESISSVPKILGDTANESISSVLKILGDTANESISPVPTTPFSPTTNGNAEATATSVESTFYNNLIQPCLKWVVSKHLLRP